MRITKAIYQYKRLKPKLRGWYREIWHSKDYQSRNAGLVEYFVFQKKMKL